mgnify:FL=1
MKNYYGRLMKLQNTLQFMPRRCPGLSIKESYRRYELDDVYGYPNRQFWTGLRAKHDIIQGARDRLCKEQAHAI